MPEPRRRLPDATELLDAMRRGDLSAEAVIAQHLERMRRREPGLNAAVEVMAEAATAEARQPRPGPLSGLPVCVKETFALAGHRITVGSIRMPPQDCDRDAEAVRRLRDAGAIVLARGNVPELAIAGETENPRYGRTENPLVAGHTCGGSSGGDGALVGSGCVAAGLGTDILGSIRIPSSFCGVVGFKPASAAISKRDSWPDLGQRFTNSWLAVGPLARSVRDIRLLYGVLADHPPPAPAAVDGLRLVTPGSFPYACRHPAISDAIVLARDALQAAGVRPEPVAEWPVRRWYHTMSRYLAFELLPLLRESLTDRAGRPLSLWRETLRQMSGAGQIYSGLHRLLLIAPMIRYRRQSAAVAGRKVLEEARAGVNAQLGQDGLLLLPTFGTLAPRHGAMNRMSLRPGVNRLMTPLTLCNYLDLPAVTVPAWRCRDAVTGLVPGVMLVAAAGAEGPLLDAAACVEATLRSPTC